MENADKQQKARNMDADTNKKKRKGAKRRRKTQDEKRT